MQLEVVTPERLAVEKECRLVTFPTSQGEVGVEDGHAHMMATLVPGEMRIYEGETREVLAISGGVMDVRPSRVVVLADAVERLEDIDVERARQAQKRAQARLEAGEKEVDMDRVQAAAARALNRIRVASQRKEA